MSKVDLEKLNNLSFDDGSKTLLDAGYVQNDSAQDDNASGCDYILDTYFTLFDEDDNEIDVKSFVQHMQKNNDDANDDGSDDIVLKEAWKEV